MTLKKKKVGRVCHLVRFQIMPSTLDVCMSCKTIQPSPETKTFVSPLRPLLGTNHVPSDAERCLAEEFLVEFSAEITSLEGQLSRLLQFKERLELFRREHRSVLSKFRMLPVEVLAMIFKIFVDSLSRREEASTASDYLDSSYAHSRNISKMKPPFTLASVCQQWRAVAISTPSLWRNIDLTRDSRFMRLGDPMSCLLTRSGQQYLNVVIDLRGWTADPPFFDAFRGSSSRWQNAQIVCDYDNDFTPVLPSNLPQLKSLSIGSPGTPVTLVASINAPKLENLELCYVSIESHFPWHQLRELSLLGMDMSAVASCLEACPGLTRLRCQLSYAGYFSASRVEQSPPLVHRNLLTLETFEGSARMRLPPDNVLRYLELPALQGLILSIPCRKDRPDDYSISDQSFPNFISRSQCKLKTFSLECIQMSKTNVTLYSSLVPTLTTLKLTENRICIYSDLLKLLAAVDGDDIVFPELQHLEYNFYARSTRDSDYHMIFASLVPVVKARWEMVSETDAVCPLQSMKIRGARPCRELNSFEGYCDLESQCQKGFNLDMQFFES